MKKNIAMRVAAILFILTMISTCAFSTTFAKYVTSGKASDSARVAKWGVAVEVTGEDAFATEYDKDDVSVAAGSKTVITSSAADADGSKLVAPGTNGVLSTLAIEGTPEVMVDVEVVSTLALAGWEAGTYGDSAVRTHCPVVFKVYYSTEHEVDALVDGDLKQTFAVGAGTVTVGSIEYTMTNGAKLSEALNAYINDLLSSDDVAANTKLNRYLKITWEWAYSVDDAHDANDTALGNLVANATAPTISMKLEATVTQVD